MIFAQNILGAISFGWSLCHKTDKFNRLTAISKAVGNLNKPMPRKYNKAATAFRGRAINYFKDCVSVEDITLQAKL